MNFLKLEKVNYYCCYKFNTISCLAIYFVKELILSKVIFIF